MTGASAAATLDFPDPLRPPIAMTAALAGANRSHREIEIEARAFQVLLRRLDMRAYGGAQGHEEGKKRQAVRFVARVEIAVQRQIGAAKRADAPEIHQQEADVVQHVDRCDLVVEL